MRKRRGSSSFWYYLMMHKHGGTPAVGGAWRLSDGTDDAYQLADGSDDAWLLADQGEPPPPSPPLFTSFAWYAADVSPITEIGGDVSQWNDISGNSNHATQPIATAQPLLVPNAINGKPALDFDGNSEFMTLKGASAMGIQNVDYEITAVGTTVKAGTNGICGDSSGAYNLMSAGAGNPGRAVTLIPDQKGFLPFFAKVGVHADVTDGLPHILSGRVDSDIGIARVDGTDGTTVASSARSNSAAIQEMGRRTFLATFWYEGLISELIFTPLLTVPQRTELNSYLVAKYGIV